MEITEFFDTVGVRAAEVVDRVNADRPPMTDAQWVAAVTRTGEAMINEVLHDIAKTDPNKAARLAHGLQACIEAEETGAQ